MAILVNNFILLCFILALVYLIWLLWFEIQKQKRPRQRRGRPFVLSPQPRNSSKDSNLKQKLIKLLHGDRQAVERLIQSARHKNPGKSPQWYEEKVLRDLERDRS
ncbi:ABC transporter permease [Synechococcus moorigangaii CMS01]|nr:ABC transporter permease [Synechococcus moorigangaii CMS01]